MNIAFFLTPKKDVAYLYDDYSLRQSLEKMKRRKYSSIPVISRDGKYVSTVTEGDFLWYLIDESENSTVGVSMHKAEGLRLSSILKKNRFEPARITATMDELIELAMNQNFVPVIDDVGTFIGIVTRKNILRYFAISVFETEGEQDGPFDDSSVG